MPSARLPCSAIFSRLPVSIADDLFDIGARILVERCDAGGRGLLQLVEQLDRQRREIIDKVQRVLDLVRDPGGQLTERGHLLGVDQVGLRRLQLLVRLAQFLLAAALFLEQPGVAQRQRRLGGEGFDEFDCLGREIAQLAAQHDEPAEDAVLEPQRHREQGAISGTAEYVPDFRGDEIGSVRHVGHLDRGAGHGGLADRALAASHRVGTQLLGDVRLQPVAGAIQKLFALGVVLVDNAGVGAGEFDGAGDHHAEHGFRVERRADGAADAAQRLEAGQGLSQVAHRVAEGVQRARHRADLVGSAGRDLNREVAGVERVHRRQDAAQRNGDRAQHQKREHAAGEHGSGDDDFRPRYRRRRFRKTRSRAATASALSSATIAANSSSALMLCCLACASSVLPITR